MEGERERKRVRERLEGMREAYREKCYVEERKKKILKWERRERGRKREMEEGREREREGEGGIMRGRERERGK